MKSNYDCYLAEFKIGVWHNYNLDLFLLSVDEGITGYMDDSLKTIKRNEIQVFAFIGN
ncbi:hypothetical protein GBA52_004156 [Prunus armeniaca]|nr:hypothetical protein GBA52_004156 [Prunus armeniaca]